MAGTTEQADWIHRVLKVAVAGAGKTAWTPKGPLLPIWVAAKESADDGIGKLQDALRGQDDDDLNTIVEFGLYGATTGQAVKLMAALRNADAQPSPGTYSKVADAVEDFRDFLDGAPIVDLIEENPFGVAVPLRRTLLPALDELARRSAA